MGFKEQLVTCRIRALLQGMTHTLRNRCQMPEKHLAKLKKPETRGPTQYNDFAFVPHRNDFISLKDILEIHKRVLGHVDPVEGGVLRTTQVYVGGHIPPGPGDLQILMSRFEQWLNSPQTLALHPVKLAALAHYKLVHIHPFADGNGRTSRLLMNTILMRAGYPPAIIAKQQRLQYYNALQTANEGDVRPFVRFIAECTGRTLDLYLWATGSLTPQIPLMTDQDDGGMVLKVEPESEGSGENRIKDDG